MTASLLANPRVPEPRPPSDDGHRTGANAPGSSAFDELETLVDRLLREQSELTAVQRFSQLVDASSEPLQARYYRALLPAASPAPANNTPSRWTSTGAAGCKACVTACHNLNGLDDDETWRDVGLLHGRSGFKTACRTDPRRPLTKFLRQQPGFEAASTTPPPPAVDASAISAATPLLQHVTTACHHCVEPGCLAACPTIAYEKDVATGIVKHWMTSVSGASTARSPVPMASRNTTPAKGSSGNAICAPTASARGRRRLVCKRVRTKRFE